MLTRIVAASLVAIVAAWGEDGSEMTRLVKATGYSLTEAIEKGLEEAGEGIPFHAELEEDKGEIAYSIDIAQGKETCNVVLNAEDGEVLENDVEDEDHTDEVKACKVSLADAIKAALKKNPGKAVEAEMSLKGGKPVVNVKVLADGEVTTVKIDAGGEEEGEEEEAPKAETKPKKEPKAAEAAYTDTFQVDDDEWASSGTNPYFILEPGFYSVFENEDGDRLTITVLNETKEVDGVETRIVEEREEEDGEIVEISRNFFAISTRTNDVYYFGEEVDIYENGKLKDHHGAWLAGKKGARFGLIMPGTPLLGARYMQEIAPGVAMDRAEIVALGVTFETPEGELEGCLKTWESSAIEKGKESKLYAPGIGLIQDEDLLLTKHGRKKK